MSKKIILVTGGAGYIGSHACKALARAGYEPVAYDNLSRGHRECVRWGPLVEGELADRALLDSTLARYKPDAVMHFAALSSVSESLMHPDLYFRNNVAASLVLFEALMASRPVPVVYSSTCAMYGDVDAVPITEKNTCRPATPYGESKLMTERMLDWFGRAHGLRHVSLRYFNAAGADPEGEIGEMHEPETHLIPLVLDAALGRRAAIDIYGTDYPTPDGTAVRDYVHVQDLAEAHLRALDHLLEGGDSATLNLGTGIGHSVRQVIATAERVTGRAVPFRDTVRRKGDAPMLIADASRAAAVLNWRAAFSGLDEIVSTAWAWHKKHNAHAHS